jgi:hypothetical protein
MSEERVTDPPRLFPLVPSPLQDMSSEIQHTKIARYRDFRERIGTSGLTV